jgi:hypothetical protein
MAIGAYLGLRSELAAQTPPIPVIVITLTNGLLNRVMLTRAGGQGFLARMAARLRSIEEIAIEWRLIDE